MPEKDGEHKHHDGHGIGHDDVGVDEHAHRHEKDGTKEVLYRLNQLDDALCLYRLGEDAAHHEGTEGAAEPHLCRQHSHEAAQAKRHDEERFAVHELAHGAQEQGHEEDAYHEPQHEEEANLHDHTNHLAAVGTAAFGYGGQDDHHDDGEDVFKDEDAHDHARKLLLAQPHVVEGFVDDRRGAHGEHATKEDAVHACPREGVAHYDAERHHKEDDGAGSDDRRHAHLQDLLEREVETKGEEEEHDANVGPGLDVAVVDDRHSVRHVGRHEKAGDHIAEYQWLLQFLEQQGDDACDNEDEGKVVDECGKF